MSPSPTRPAEPLRMVDIAQKAGVSRMAVSAVLMGTGNGRVRVSTETAERIRKIADDLGYRPNRAAQQLAGRGSGIVAVVANDCRNFLTQRALAWLHEAAQQDGLRVMAQFAPEGPVTLEQLIQDVRAGWVDGIVYLAFENEQQWPVVAELFGGFPQAVVAIGDVGDPRVNSVISDVVPGARASMAHLKDQGRSRPVFIAEEDESLAFRHRREAYREAAGALELDFDDRRIVIETRGWLVSNPEYYERFDRLARRIVDDLGADAVLCDTDFTAVALCRAFRRLGLRIAEAVSVIGWGDLQMAAMFDPPLTTVSLELPTLLRRVVARLRDELVPGESPRIERVATQLVVRESS